MRKIGCSGFFRKVDFSRRSSLLFFFFLVLLLVDFSSSVLYVDNTLDSDCVGAYNLLQSTGSRCDGSDSLTAYAAIEDVTGYYRGTTQWIAPVVALAAGERVIIRGGTHGHGDGNSNVAMLHLNVSGGVGNPIIFEAYEDERVVFAPTDAKQAVLEVRGSNLIFDGIDFTLGGRQGIRMIEVENVTLRNCEVYNNNEEMGSTQGGIEANGGRNILVEYCSSYANANGLIFGATGWPSDFSIAATGCFNCTARHNLLFNNTKTSNAGNSDGLVARFAHRALFRNNSIWENPDGGIDMLGTTMSVVEYNCVYNNSVCVPESFVTDPANVCGNGEGIKMNVRGGGANVIRYNVVYGEHSNAIQDAWAGDRNAGGIGNLFYNNVVHGDSNFGLLSEGLATMWFNNLEFATTNGYGVSYGHIPLSFLNNSVGVDPLFVSAGSANFRLMSSSSAIDAGRDFTSLGSFVAGSLSDVISTAEDEISSNSGSGVVQSEQAASAWQLMVDELEGGDISYYVTHSGVRDFDGTLVPLGSGPDIGAFEFLGFCGNGAVEPGEQCDDGDLSDGNGCDRFCSHEMLLFEEFDGATTNFSELDASDVLNATLEMSAYGRIEFESAVNFSGLNLDRYVSFSDEFIEINSSDPGMSRLDVPSRLFFYGVSYSNPVILRNGAVCSDCVELGYSGGVFSARVPGFSYYSVAESSGSGSSSGGGGSGGGGGGGGGSSSSENTCIENWVCDSWGNCLDGVQRRVCFDENECASEVDKPEDLRECALGMDGGDDFAREQQITQESVRSESGGVWFFVVMGFFGLIGIFVIVRLLLR